MREHKKSHLGIMGWAMFLAGAMSLGSCSSDETLESMEPKAITFGSVSMENHSRAAADPSYGDNKLIDGFQVWGTVKGNTNNTVNIFNGATIERGSAAYGAAWTQTSGSAQYWIPTADYTFMAVANAKSVTTDAGIPAAIEFELTDGSKDLILSNTVNVKTDASAEPTTGVNNNKCVPFEFTHLLSKVHFTFDGSAANVANIQVTGHNGTGTYNISTATWGSQQSTTTPLIFGGIDGTTSANARLIIPGEQTWTIRLYELKNLENQEYVQIGSDITLNKATATGTNETGGFIFAPNTQYNINISLGVETTLSVSVRDWTPHNVVSEFANTVAVDKAEDKITWIKDIDGDNSDDYTVNGANVVMNASPDVPARFTFKISGPVGGEWIAFFVKESGANNAFTLNFLGDNVHSDDAVAIQGEIGKSYTVEVRCKGTNKTNTANVAELRFMVRQADQLLPVDVLTNLPNGGNYKIVQNNELN